MDTARGLIAFLHSPFVIPRSPPDGYRQRRRCPAKAIVASCQQHWYSTPDHCWGSQMDLMLTLTHATERDVDLLLVEEMRCSSSFVRWLVGLLSASTGIPI